jgi:hypothetical protein
MQDFQFASDSNIYQCMYSGLWSLGRAGASRPTLRLARQVKISNLSTFLILIRRPILPPCNSTFNVVNVVSNFLSSLFANLTSYPSSLPFRCRQRPEHPPNLTPNSTSYPSSLPIRLSQRREQPPILPRSQFEVLSSVIADLMSCPPSLQFDVVNVLSVLRSGRKTFTM